jgi:DNA-binding PadR family transcriptional regulator
MSLWLKRSGEEAVRSIQAQRIIRGFVKDRTNEEFWWFAEMETLLTYLIDDGLLQDSGKTRQSGGLVQKLYKLTKSGQLYVAQWPTG